MPLEINKRGAFLTALILGSICYILYSTSDETKSDPSNQSDSISSSKGKDKFDSFLKAEEMAAEKEQSDHDLEIGLDVEYVEDSVDVGGVKVYYRYAISTLKDAPPTRFSVLLLHGAAFSSQTWKGLGTLQFIRRSGYFPIAVDLPGFGKTKNSYNSDKADFLQKLIAALPFTERPVIISPSMSGRYSLPFIMKHAADIRGFIPVAPVNDHYKEDDFKNLQLPALIIYGGNDNGGKKTSQLIQYIPNSRMEELPDASHAAYLDDTQHFHNLVKDFLDDIYKEEKQSKEEKFDKSVSKH